MGNGHPKLSTEQALCEVILETVFPTCAIFQLPGPSVNLNESTLNALKTRKTYQQRECGQLITGSTAEGLTLQEGWGHPLPDWDSMWPYGAELGVTIPGPRSLFSRFVSVFVKDKSCLKYVPQGCPPAYARLKITDKEALLLNEYVAADCVDPGDWLNTRRLNERINQIDAETDSGGRVKGIKGPAAQPFTPGGYQLEYVSALLADSPHPAIEDYVKRLRGEWPQKEQLDELQYMPLLLVLVGSKESQNPNQQARSSWSTGEMLLISKLPTIIKKGFIAAKCTFKHCVGNYRDGNMDCDGRSHVGSYHLKTTLLNHLEKVPPSKYYSSFHLMMNLFEDLRVYLERGNLPHHFLPECNLLSTIGSDERKIALDTIEHIVHDPKAIILKCPSNRVTIYGDIHPDDLVKTFGSVFGDPGCKQSWKDLSQILSRLDQHRQFLYRKQLESDKCLCRSPRPELTGLVDMLKKIKHD